MTCWTLPAGDGSLQLLDCCAADAGPAGDSAIAKHIATALNIRNARAMGHHQPTAPGSTPSCQNRKLQTSVASSSCLLRGLPWPCPADVSTRNRIGADEAVEAWRRAAILRACIGSTRLSPSAVN